LLAQFNLEGIPPARRGVPQIEVAFDIDVNGILNVSAKDVATGKEQSVKIEESSGLSDDEIDDMRKDADTHAEEDKQKRKFAEAHNEASRLVYDTEKLMKEHADKLDDASKSAIEASMEKVNEALKGEDLAAVESAVEELNQATHALSKHMYESAAEPTEEASAGDAAQETGAEDAPDDNVIDAEFEKTE